MQCNEFIDSLVRRLSHRGRAITIVTEAEAQRLRNRYRRWPRDSLQVLILVLVLIIAFISSGLCASALLCLQLCASCSTEQS